MKTSLLRIAGFLLAFSAIGAQVAITSFDRKGKLTWTNSVPRAIYEIDAALSPVGPWVCLDFVTNQTSYVIAPYLLKDEEYPALFFKIATDPPPETNVFCYSAFDSHGSLVITGQLNLLFYGDSSVTGTWALERAGDATNQVVGPQVGEGQLVGGFEPIGGAMYLNLNAPRVDAVLLIGQATGYATNAIVRYEFSTFWTNFVGKWSYYPEWPPWAIGTFVASRRER